MQLERKLERAKPDTCTSLYHIVWLLTIGIDVTSPDTNVQPCLVRLPLSQDTHLPQMGV